MKEPLVVCGNIGKEHKGIHVKNSFCFRPVEASEPLVVCGRCNPAHEGKHRMTEGCYNPRPVEASAPPLSSGDRCTCASDTESACYVHRASAPAAPPASPREFVEKKLIDDCFGTDCWETTFDKEKCIEIIAARDADIAKAAAPDAELRELRRQICDECGAVFLRPKHASLDAVAALRPISNVASLDEAVRVVAEWCEWRRIGQPENQYRLLIDALARKGLLK